MSNTFFQGEEAPPGCGPDYHQGQTLNKIL